MFSTSNKKIRDKKINIAFFGSSEFSIPTLEHLLGESSFNVTSIITLPPAQKNRGKKLSNNVVHDFALKKSFQEEKIFTPNKLRNNDEIFNVLNKQDIDFIVVVAYGKIIPINIINIPKYEILNLHPSSLPKYRGAAPIERAIEAGEKKIDICIMRVDEGLDTGDVCERKEYALNISEGADKIVPNVAKIGANLMIDVIKKCVRNEVFFLPQTGEDATYASKIDKSELFIDLQNDNLDAEKVFNKIRAFNNSGCCYFIYNEKRIKIISCELLKVSNSVVGFDVKSGCLLFRNGTIKPIILQKEGKNPISLKDYLNGLK